eukprot:244620-Hanusia_phi.AAC.1
MLELLLSVLLVASFPWLASTRSCSSTLIDPLPVGNSVYTIGVDMNLSMPAIALQASGVQEQEEIEISFNVSASNNSSTSVNFFFLTVQQGVLPIRQHLNEVADEVQQNFEPLFWFEDSQPLPPRYAAGTDNGQPQVRIVGTLKDLSDLLLQRQWLVRSSAAMDFVVNVVISNGLCQQAIPVSCRIPLSDNPPVVKHFVEDERAIYETEKFQWQGSYSHLYNGQEAKLPFEWIPPPCDSVQTDAAWTPCSLFVRPDSPAVYSDASAAQGGTISKSFRFQVEPSRCWDAQQLLKVTVSVQNANSSRANFPAVSNASLFSALTSST